LVLVLGVLQLGVSYALYAEAIKHVTALEAMLIPLIEPILNPVWVMLALGERPGPWAMVGAALVLGAVLLRGIVMVRRRRNQIEL
jgi:drug/metabolite transporter (DMT)-like permease